MDTPIIGYRVWDLFTGFTSDTHGDGTYGTVLAPMTYRKNKKKMFNPWRAGPIAAAAEDSTGLYAFKRPLQAVMKARNEWPVGVVRLSGTVHEHMIGYRATRAQVMSLVFCKDMVTMEQLKDIAELYHCDISCVPTYERFRELLNHGKRYTDNG